LENRLKSFASILPLALVCAASLMSGAASAQTAVSEEVRGKRLFLQCRACHDVSPSASSKLGPNLYGVVGRRAASVPGFTYSPALAASHLTWTESSLDQWLKQPSVMVPKTSMVFGGVPNPADRSAIIAYLKSSR
jgi:cytochrome c